MIKHTEEYKPPLNAIDRILIILYNITFVMSFTQNTVVKFYSDWHADIVGYTATHIPIKSMFIFHNMLILVLLYISTRNKVNIFLQVMSGSCVIVLIQWFTNLGLHSGTIDRILTSPLKEQCHTLINIMPLVTIGFCILIWLIITIYHRNPYSPIPDLFNIKIFLILLAFSVIAIPYILRPIITSYLL